MSNWKKRPLRVSQVRYAGMSVNTHRRMISLARGVAHKSFISLNFPPVTDAYCLLDVYSTLSSNPALFGLPADLRGICQAEKSRDRKQKSESETEQKKRADHEEVRSRLCSVILMI